jgi:hypothetical protein
MHVWNVTVSYLWLSLIKYLRNDICDTVLLVYLAPLILIHVIDDSRLHPVFSFKARVSIVETILPNTFVVRVLDIIRRRNETS